MEKLPPPADGRSQDPGVGVDLPLPRPDDPLAQPTRARLFALLVALRRPATTDELAERLGRHPNGVRVHLDRLLSAGLLVRTRVPASRGQPRDRWSVHPDAEPGDPERVCFALGSCPYRDAVHDNQPVVCSLHTGITEGLLDALDSAARLLRFVPHDPDEAGCVVDAGAVGGSSR
jgi:predicted ArsR family transcriptional regulator